LIRTLEEVAIVLPLMVEKKIVLVNTELAVIILEEMVLPINVE